MQLPNDRSSLKKMILEKQLLPYQCQECKNLPEWNKKPLSLQLDHINGIRNDNRLENLRFLCPNCHSQTPTYSRGNVKRQSIFYKDMSNKIFEFIDECNSCRQLILKFGLSDHSTQYQKIYRLLELLKDHPKIQAFEKRKIGQQQIARTLPRLSRRKVVRPSKNELEKMVWEKPSTQIAKDFGLTSSNTILQWCREYGINKPTRGHWMKKNNL